MKKEFKATENITCRFTGLVDSKNTARCSDLVVWKIRSYELEKLREDKDYKDIVSELDKLFSVSADQATKAQVKQACNNDQETADLFSAHLDLIKTAEKAVKATGVKLDDFNALHQTDKAFILLEAHKNIASIGIDLEADFSKAVNAYFNKGELKQAKDLFRTAFFSAVGQDGDLFHGVRLKKSDFQDRDIRNALAKCGGNAGRQKTKDKDGNEKLKAYDWIVKSDKSTISRIASNLFAVVMESRKDQIEQVKHTGVTLDEQPKEQPKKVEHAPVTKMKKEQKEQPKEQPKK